MGLIEIPPYVRADENPPTMAAEVRGFHLRSYEVLEPVDFPRELFVEALAEHAHLIEVHAAEILSAPLDHPGKPADDRFIALDDVHLCASLLVCDGEAHEVHRWRMVDLSYVVQRCRGIVRQLMEVPSDGCTYVVVVARGVASLHLLRGVAPRRAGDGPTLEPVERDLVVEPWEQWHLRDRDFVRTWWRTPAGDLVASRVRVRSWPKNAREVTDVLLTLRSRGLRQQLDEYKRLYRRRLPVAVLDTTVRGEEIFISDRRERDRMIAPFPELVEALHVGRPGLDPVVVYDYHWAALCWLPVAVGTDVAVPEPLIASRTPQPDDDVYDDEEEEEEKDAKDGGEGKKKREPRLRLTGNSYLVALFDDFPPLDPWAPRAREVNAAWIAGLVLAAYAVLLVIAAGEVASRWTDLFAHRLFGIAAVGLAACGTFLAFHYFRWRLRELDPARRRYRWRAWKQVKDELERGANPPKPKPRVLGRKYWMRKLAQRLARLERLVGLGAPEIIVENERKLVRDAIAELSKSDADAVLAAWPVAVRHLEPQRAPRGAGKSGGGMDKPN